LSSGPKILALRHQLAVLQRATPKRPRLRPIDRLFWVLLSRVRPSWRQAVQIVTPATVVGWHRRAFTTHWRWNPRPRRVGRPALTSDLRALIRQMRRANPLWGAPRIHGELQKLGIEVSQATVALAELFARNELTGALEQHREQLQGLLLKVETRTGLAQPARAQVEFEDAKRDLRLRGCAGFAHGTRNRADAARSVASPIGRDSLRSTAYAWQA